MDMKTTKFLLLTSLVLFSSRITYSQNQLEQDFASITNELKSWDPVRGEWLAKSMFAIANNQVIPDRNFPENFTPYELMTMVPLQHKEAIRTIAENQSTNSRTNPNPTGTSGNSSQQFWTVINEILARQNCQTTNGRTFGDPHFTSFDGNGFSLQSVGEFILAKSKTGYFEVQARQHATDNNFSLNTAVAMNVGGDRLCIYAGDTPDSDQSTPLRLNGQAIHSLNSTYFLPHGGTITSNYQEYTITWPTGEKVIAHIRNGTSFANFAFMDITTQIFPCSMGGFEGLLGNANGIPNDDLQIPNGGQNHAQLYESMSRYSNVFANSHISNASNTAEKEYQERLTRDFGNYWRITDLNTLFDYSPGRSTASYTDMTFPIIHHTIGDLNNSQRTIAQRNCEDAGLTGNELRGCIYDNGFLNIPPSPRPTITDPTNGIVLGKVDPANTRPNVNRPVPTGTVPTGTVPTGLPAENSKVQMKDVPPPTVQTPQPVIEHKTFPGGNNPVPQTIPQEQPKQSLPSKLNDVIFGNGNSSPVHLPENHQNGTPHNNPVPIHIESKPASTPIPSGGHSTPVVLPSIKKGG